MQVKQDHGPPQVNWLGQIGTTAPTKHSSWVSHDSCKYPLAIEHSEPEAMAIMALFSDDFPSELNLHLFHRFSSSLC